jgi:hypothetical protein
VATKDWLLSGNSHTDPRNDFIGTSDNQPLVIRTANAERVRIDLGGNVGIGDPSPTFPLHLAVGKALRIEGGTDATDSALYFSFGGNGAFSIDAPGVPSGRFIVTNSGGVGINNNNPAANLDVGGNMRVSDVDQRGNTSTVSILAPDTNGDVNISSPAPFLVLQNTIGGRGALCEIDFHTFTGAVSSCIQAVDMGNNNNDIIFWTKPPGGTTGLLAERMRITSTGNINVPGDIILTGADCAEQFDLAADTEIPEPGTVVVLGDGGGLAVSHGEYDRKVVGVVSGAGDYKHGILLDNRPGCSDHRVAVALAGKVCCKVDARYEPVAVGDLLTTSPTPGHAMKASEAAHAFGSVVGKALQALDSDQGLIPIVVALQ